MRTFLFTLLLFVNSTFANTVIGNWQTFDDETNTPRAEIEISEATDGSLIGKIIKLYRNTDAICTKCDGEKKDQPILGMIFLWGLKPNGENHWSDGHILDPETGTEYDAKITLSEDGQSLSVRGFAGISLLGRTQIWKRL